MIHDIFFPSHVGSYYFVSQRVVGCEINKNQVRATVIKATGRSRIVEMVLEESIETDPVKSLHERTLFALKRLFSAIGKYDIVHTTLPGNMVILKELTVPFHNIAKIKLILPFEMEALLPFPLSESTIDCIVTGSDKKTTTVLAAAVKNDLLNERRALFLEAGVNPAKISIDLLELYGVYHQMMPQPVEIHELLVYVGFDTIRLGVLVGGQLKAVRVLQQGLHKLTKLVGYESDDALKRHGIAHEDALLSRVSPFFSDIQFTMDAFLNKLSPGEKFTRIALMGPGVEIAGLAELFNKALGTSIELVTTNKIIQHGIAQVRGTTRVPNAALISFCSALLCPMTQDFNLNQEYETNIQSKIFNWQIGVSLGMLLLIFGVFIVHGILHVHAFNKEIEASERETVELLKKELPDLQKRRDTSGHASLDTVNRVARAEVMREKNIWFALSPQNRSSFLVYLQELFTSIDPEGLGLDLRRLTLTEDTLTLEGHVADYEALKRFEEDLRHLKMLSNVPKLEELTFTAKMTLEKSYRAE